MADFNPAEFAFLEQIFNRPSSVEHEQLTESELVTAIHRTRVEELSSALYAIINKRIGGRQVSPEKLDAIKPLLEAYQASRGEMMRVRGMNSTQQQERDIADLFNAAQLNYLLG